MLDANFLRNKMLPFRESREITSTNYRSKQSASKQNTSLVSDTNRKNNSRNKSFKRLFMPKFSAADAHNGLKKDKKKKRKTSKFLKNK